MNWARQNVSWNSEIRIDDVSICLSSDSLYLEPLGLIDYFFLNLLYLFEAIEAYLM